MGPMVLSREVKDELQLILVGGAAIVAEVSLTIHVELERRDEPLCASSLMHSILGLIVEVLAADLAPWI